MSDEQVTAALSELSLSQLPPRAATRPNFPLPRELRDQIYGYLLDGEYARTGRKWSSKGYHETFDHSRSGPRAYHFHTGILGVNRAIHDEAEELLYKRNVFVILSYQYSGLGNDIGGLIWLPIVSNKHAARMQKHSVRIHVTSGTVTLSKDDTGTPTVGLPVAFGMKVAAPQFKCELRNTKYRQIDAATQQQILALMACILAPSQRVSFSGNICDFQQVEHLKQLMSPSLSCVPAYNWSRFKTLSLAKDVADATMHLDDIEFTMKLYKILEIAVAVSTHTLRKDATKYRIFLAVSPEASDACDILRLETLVSVACCAIKKRDIGVLRGAGDHIRQVYVRRAEESTERNDIPPELGAHCCSVILWFHLYSGQPLWDQTIKDAVERLARPGHSHHQVHDSKILLRQPDQEVLVTSEHLPIGQCSAFQLPVPTTSFHKALKEEERFEGWLDKDLLRALDGGMKNNINAQQRMFGIKVTAFEELGV